MVKLKENEENAFVNYAPTINREILEYLNKRPFKVVEYENLSYDSTGVLKIQFEDGEPVSRLEALPKFKEITWSPSWFYEDEFELFEEVDEPKTQEPPVEDKDLEEYIIHVSGVEPTEYGGATGYIVGTNSCPQRFTLEAAKEHAKFVLDGATSKVKVNIFRLETTASLVSEIKFV